MPAAGGGTPAGHHDQECGVCRPPPRADERRHHPGQEHQHSQPGHGHRLQPRHPAIPTRKVNFNHPVLFELNRNFNDVFCFM